MSWRRALPWTIAALAAPLCAHALLDRAVDKTLTAALEEASGEVVFVDDVDVSLFGSFRVERLRIGDVVAVGSLEARLSISELIGGRLRTAEVLVDEPRADLRGGGARLAEVARRLKRRRRGKSRAPDHRTAAKKWPNVRVRRGVVRVDGGERGSLLIDGFSVRPTEGGLRLTADSSTLRSGVGGHSLEVSLGRAAADFDIENARVSRLIASGGVVHVGELATLEAVEVSYGLGAANLAAKPRATARLVGRWGGGRVSISSSGDHIELSLSSVAATELSAFFKDARLTGGRISGNVGVETSSEQSATLTGSLLLRDVRGTLPWLFGAELDLSSEVAGSAQVSWQRGHSITIPNLQIRRGPASARLRGSLEKPDRTLATVHGTLSVDLEPVDCSALATAMPVALVGPLRGIRIRGTVKGGATLRVGQSGARPVELDVDLDESACRVLRDAPTAEVSRLARGYKHLLPSGRQVTLSAGRIGYTKLASLPKHVAAAFVVAEDGRFRRHHGFDSRQIETSIAKDLAVGRFARGGSTITQQLAKNLYLSRERTVGRKLQEAVLAWRIEDVLTKDQILERYLNVIQLSDTDYGIEAAARRWFGKSPKRLSPREAAFLASLTRAPTTTTRVIAESGGLTPAMVRRVEHILRSMKSIGAIDRSTYRSARRARLRLATAIASR